VLSSFALSSSLPRCCLYREVLFSSPCCPRYCVQRLIGPGRLAGLVTLDKVIPWGFRFGLAVSAKLLSPVLKVCDIRVTSDMSALVLWAPLGGDPAVVAAPVLSLSVVAHICVLFCC